MRSVHSDDNSDDYPEQEADVSTFATQDELVERPIIRLPKRLRVARFQPASTVNPTFAGFEQAAEVESASHSGSEGLPQLASASISNDGTSSGASAECLTPPAYSAYYQPVFASVATLVKQVAATTTLFGNGDALPLTDTEEEDHDHEEEAVVRESNRENAAVGIPTNNRKKRKVPAPMGSNHFPSSPPSFAARPLDDEDSLLGFDDLDGDRTSARSDFASDPRSGALASTPTKKARTPYSGYNRSPQSSAKAKMKRQSPLSPSRSNDASPHSSGRKSVRIKQARVSPTLPELPVIPANLTTEESTTTEADDSIILPNLWDPKLGWLVPKKSKLSNPQVDSQSVHGQSVVRAIEKGPALPAAPFQFHIPLSQMLSRRLEELTREKERLQLARDVARERLRDLEQVKRRAEAELAAAKRKNSGIHYVTEGIQTSNNNEGRIIFASRWSTVEPSQPLTRPPKAQKTPADQAASAAKKGKKKRSALANANNAHHRDNYVPSRHAKSGAPPGIDHFPSLGLVGSDNAFSTENYHPQLGYSNLIPFFAGPDEWICSWCESALFFGDEAAFQRLIRKRKSLVKIRKRAQRRAARAAAGQAQTKTKKSKPAPVTNATPSTRKNSAVQTVDPKVDPHAIPVLAPAAAKTAAKTQPPTTTTKTQSPAKV